MTDIRCPSQSCKLMYVVKHDSGILESHLLRCGFMNGYTRWIGDEDDEDVNGVVGHEDHGHQDKNGEGRLMACRLHPVGNPKRKV
jgi:hypothetical protein